MCTTRLISFLYLRVYFLTACCCTVFFLCAQNTNTKPSFSIEKWKSKPTKTPADINALKDAYNALKTKDVKTELQYAKLAYDASKLIQNDSLLIVHTYWLATTYYLQVDSLEQAYAIFLENYPIVRKHPDHPLGGGFANTLGNLALETLTTSEALPYYYESIEFFKKSNQHNDCTYPLGNISQIFFEDGKIDKAIEYTREAEQYSKKLDEPFKSYNLAYDYARLADFLLHNNQGDSVDYYIAKSFKAVNIIQQQYPDYHMLNSLINDMNLLAASIYTYQKKYALAEEYLRKTPKNALFSQKNESILQLAELAFAQSQYQKSEEYLNQVESTIISEYHKENFFSLKQKIYRKTSKYKMALAMSDSLFLLQSTRTEKQRLRMQVMSDIQYQVFKKQEQIASLENEREIANLRLQRSRAFLSVGLLGLLLLFVLLFSLYRKNNRKNRFNLLLQEEVKKKTEHLQNTKAELERINDDLRQINYVISHDLKEPLRTIVSFSTLAKKIAPENAKLQEFMGFINQSGKHLSVLINDVLEFNKIDRSPLKSNQVVDVNQVVHEITISLDDLLTRLKAKVTLQNTLPTLQTSKTALFIVFKNLIENGIKYNKNAYPEVVISYTATPHEHQFFFQDNGMGIDAQFHEQIFQISKRLHNRSEIEGSGLGLAISKKIAKKHHGDLRVHASEPGKGSTFVLVLPIRTPVIQEANVPPNPQYL